MSKAFLSSTFLSDGAIGEISAIARRYASGNEADKLHDLAAAENKLIEYDNLTFDDAYLSLYALTINKRGYLDRTLANRALGFQSLPSHVHRIQLVVQGSIETKNEALPIDEFKVADILACASAVRETCPIALSRPTFELGCVMINYGVEEDQYALFNGEELNAQLRSFFSLDNPEWQRIAERYAVTLATIIPPKIKQERSFR